MQAANSPLNFAFMPDSNAIEVIENRLTELGLKKVDFCRQIGVSTQTYNNWRKRGVPANKTKKISDVLNINRDHLEKAEKRFSVLSGPNTLGRNSVAHGLTQGSFQVKSNTRTSREAKIDKQDVAINSVPLLAWHQLDNLHLTLRNQDSWQGEVPCPVIHSQSAFSMVWKGESMADYYPDGYTIFIDPEIEPVHGDDVIAKLIPENEFVFRRFMLDGGKPYLKTLNRTWPNTVIPAENGLQVVGVVFLAARARQQRTE